MTSIEEIKARYQGTEVELSLDSPCKRDVEALLAELERIETERDRRLRMPSSAATAIRRALVLYGASVFATPEFDDVKSAFEWFDRASAP